MTRRYSGPVILSIGFRPFFIASAAWAVLSMLAWIAALGGHIDLPGHIAPSQWHFNELMFGVIGAAMTGFLFTAIPNWTGRLPLRGIPLLLLFSLWCAGRAVAIFGESVGGIVSALVDSSFFIVFFALVLREILHGQNWRNLPIAFAVGLLGVAHILFYYEALGMGDFGGVGQRLGLGVLACLLTLIGGRIVPSFTANWLKQHGGSHGVAAVMGPVDRAVLLITVPSVLAWVFVPEHQITGVALVIAGVANLLRLLRWRGVHTFAEPLLFVLHVGYAWLALSLMLLGSSVLSDVIARSDALHALTAGAAGTMILAVMSRAILGHTGSALHADRITSLAFLFVSFAAITRLAIIALPDFGPELYAGSGFFWMLSFGLFVWRFGPIAFRE